MRVSDIIVRAGRTLADATHVRWTEAEIIDHINDGQRQIVLLKPNANSRTETFRLAAGTKQALPAGGIALLRVLRNMGGDGLTPGTAVFPTIRSAMDAETPDWHTKVGSEIQHFIYDYKTDKRTFYVYPASAGNYVELTYSAAPAEVTSTSSELDLDDTYINEVLNWVLHRCFAKDTEYAGNAQRAAEFLGAFYRGLELSAQVEALTNPTNRVRNSELERR